MKNKARTGYFDVFALQGGRHLMWGMVTLLFSGAVHAASLTAGPVFSDVSEVFSDLKQLTLGSEEVAFLQADNDPLSGMTELDTLNRVRYLNAANSAYTAPTVHSLVFNGNPVELGIPGELGSLTIGAGNTIADVTTDRTYSRPVVFTQLVSDAGEGAIIVPTMPLMAGNTFSFSVEAATGQSPDLEGATLHYFIAEEGWHRLVDGRLLLVSSTELRDEGFTGQTIELGADFSDAAAVIQLQRPALILNGDGSVTPRTGYQGAAILDAGYGTISSLALRYMADATYEAGNSALTFGARIGFMVLGEATVSDGWPLVYRQYYSSVHADAVVGEGYFENYQHSAAASPMFNKIACADDADLDGYCFFMSPPADLLSRQSKFDLPRLPYVDEKFEPLTLNLTKHGEAYDYDYWWDIDDNNLRDASWESVVEEAAEQPNNLNKYSLGECAAPDDCPVNGALSQGLPKYDTDRWWDLYGFGNTRMEYGHWYNLRNYDACVQDGVSTACTDLTPEDLFGSPGIDWDAQTLQRTDWRVDITLDTLNAFPPEQAVFTEMDASYVDGKKFYDMVMPDINSAHRLATYLNFDVPDDIEWLTCNVYLPFSGYPGPMDVFHRLQHYANFYAKELKLDPWQIMASKLWVMATETKDINGYTYSDSYLYGMYIPIPANDDTWQFLDWGVTGGESSCFVATDGRVNPSGFDRSYIYDYESSYERVIKPVIAMMGEYVAPGDGIFSNYPYTGSETNLRWVRSSAQNHATATTVASGQAGYVATAADENKYLSFCLDNSEGETVCAEDWVRVKATPYLGSISIWPPSAYALIGNNILGSWSFISPTGDPESGTKTWWVVDNSIDTDATPHATHPRTMVYSTTGMSPGGWVKFCVQPSTDYVTGETVCSEKVFVDYDSDGDGINNSSDWDDDNDGWSDAHDSFPLDASEQRDNDGDGIGDNADTDDDNDGLSDDEESSLGTDPYDPNTDGDDLIDGEDPYPLYAGEWLDVDGDGIHDKDDTDNDNDNVDDIYDAKRLEACVSANIVVTNDNDSGPGSLRQALSDLCPIDPDSPLDNGTITFDGPYTIRLQSPLAPYGGVTMDGNNEVTISGDSDGDGIADVPIFTYELPDYLPQTQNLQLRNITLSDGKSENGQGSVVNLESTRFAFFDKVLLSHNEGPAVLIQKGQVYIENSIVAHGTGSDAAILNAGGFVGVATSTFINNEGGAIAGSSYAEQGWVWNSLLLRGESGSATCNLTLISADGNWLEEGGMCGDAGDGNVALADAANGDYRPVPGSSSIDAGVEQEAMTTDYAGNPRIQNLIPDAGALEYDPTGDFDGDGVSDSSDAFPADSTETLDSDSDGVGDNADAFPNDPTRTSVAKSGGGVLDPFALLLILVGIGLVRRRNSS